jgi:excisionase family DNA binding protein
MEKFLTLKEMAEVLNVNPSTLRREAIAGRIPFVKVGRVFRFRAEHVLSSLAANASTDSHCRADEPSNDTAVSDEAVATSEQSGPRPAGPERPPAMADPQAMTVPN